MPAYPNVRIPIAFVIHAATNGTLAVRVPTPDQTASETGYSNITSGLSSTNVQTAIDELSSEKVDKTTTVNGHALSSNVTVTKSDVGLGSVVNADTTTTVNITDSSNKRFVTDAQLVVL